MAEEFLGAVEFEVRLLLRGLGVGGSAVDLFLLALVEFVEAMIHNGSQANW
jgi:hypothetical protein